MTNMTYSDRLATAFDFAQRAHRGQVRKGSTVPYICHPMGVASLVIEGGGSEDAVIAALLHDVVEDTDTTLAQISGRFGAHVTYLVGELTHEKIDWKLFPKEDHAAILREQRVKQIDHLRIAHHDVRLVKEADTLYNVQAILDQYGTQGERTFKSFRGGAEEVVLKYSEMCQLFLSSGPSYVLAERIEDALIALGRRRMKKLLRAG